MRSHRSARRRKTLARRRRRPWAQFIRGVFVEGLGTALLLFLFFTTRISQENGQLDSAAESQSQYWPDWNLTAIRRLEFGKVLELGFHRDSPRSDMDATPGVRTELR